MAIYQHKSRPFLCDWIEAEQPCIKLTTIFLQTYHII